LRYRLMAQIARSTTTETFTVRDLRERTGDLIRSAEQGQLSVIAKHGKPVFVAVPFDDALPESGVRVSRALKLFDDGTLSLAQVAKFSGFGIEAFIERAGTAGLTVVQTTPEELDAEPEVIVRHGRSG
jgi:prevent-host-death family protein